MDIRLIVMMSIFATVLVVSGCASTEEPKPASGPSMKEMPTAKDMSGKTKETPAPPMTREMAPAPMTKEPSHSAPMKGTSAVTSDPLQACLAAAAKGNSTGQRDLAEPTCRRDFGTADSRAVSSGTQGDTVQGCLARIPKDATAGQRMLAEQSCSRDEEIRRGF
jgi:hypothetical protein